MRPLISRLCAGGPALVLALFALGGCAATPDPKAPMSVLPLRTLRLYETGVGYFERSGVAASSDTSLPVPAGHLDDALKTLVVLGKDGKASVQSVEFNSSVSAAMARTLAGLPSDPNASISYSDLLTTLRGAHVEVRTARETITGRLVDVLTEPRRAEGDAKASGMADGTKKPGIDPVLLVLTDRSEVRRLPSDAVQSVRPTDPALAGRIDTALDALSPRGAQARRMVRVSAASSAPITLGYVAESPVWRTTYRLVTDATGKKGVLQAWALLHNDTDEDWRNVGIELANGRPDSFLFPLAAPRYERRELVKPDRELSTVPQLADKTVDSLWGGDDALGAGGLGLTGVGEGGGGYGHGIGLGSVGTIGHGAGTGGTSSSSVLDVGNLASVAQATGAESGALFLYKLPRTLDLRAHGSALVPFLQQGVEARSLCWFARADEAGRAGVRFVNSTAQTLPPGTIAVFADGGFAGESAVDRLKPGERRFIRYGVDLDVELKQDHAKVQESSAKLTFDRDVLEEHFVRHTDRVYRIVNRSGQPRSVFLALDFANNAKVVGADELDYDMAASTPVAVFDAKAKSEASRTLVADEGLKRTFALGALSSEGLHRLAAQTSLEDPHRRIAAEAEGKQKLVEETRARRDKLKADNDTIEKDLTRLREHLKAMGDKTPQAPNALVARILGLEDKLAAQRRELEALDAEGRKRADAVRAVLARLGG